MRIGVDYRVLAVGEDLIRRGLGRFTQQQLRAVLAADQENTYVLLCPPMGPVADPSLIEPAIRRAPNVTIRHFTPSRPVTVPPDPQLFLRQNEEFQDWVAGQSIDVYHATTPFVPEPPLLTGFDACPMVTTFYDVIPLVFPAHYLFGWWEEQYERTLALLLQSERLIAISEAARADAVNYLGFPADRIDVVWPIADECFRTLSAADTDAALRSLRRRVRLPERFAITVSHFHHTKNVHALLRAYSLLSPAMRAELPLVISCHLDQRLTELLDRMVSRFDLGDCVVATGRVTDEELAALYNAAVLAVHPSRYEGFGLPVIEAMSCGTPVITTTSSSLPEVAGDAAVLVDPDDARAMADNIRALSADEPRRRAMVERGLANVERVNPEQLAANTARSYRRAVAAASPGDANGPRAWSVAADRPRLAIWTPLPSLGPEGADDPDEVAEWPELPELLRRLANRYDLEIFVGDGCLPRAALLRQHRVQHFTAFARRHRQRPFDLTLYRLGPSSTHSYMAPTLLAHPGVVVLDDGVTSHVLHDSLDRRAFHAELARTEGDAALRQLRTIEAMESPVRRKLLDELLDLHPMTAAVVDASLAQIVHLQTASDALRYRCPGADPFVVGMGVADPYSQNPAIEYREARVAEGLGAADFLIAAVGGVDRASRLEVCIRALPGLLEVRRDTTLLVIGPESEDGYVRELEELAADVGAGGRIQFLGQVDHDRFDRLLVACDVVVNLGAASPLSMSTALNRAAAAGKPTIISDVAEWRDLPVESFVRLPGGSDEPARLAIELRSLAFDIGRRATMGRNARHYWSTHATIDRTVSDYASVIDEVLAASLRPTSGPPTAGSIAHGGRVASVQ